MKIQNNSQTIVKSCPYKQQATKWQHVAKSASALASSYDISYSSSSKWSCSVSKSISSSSSSSSSSSCCAGIGWSNKGKSQGSGISESRPLAEKRYFFPECAVTCHSSTFIFFTRVCSSAGHPSENKIWNFISSVTLSAVPEQGRESKFSIVGHNWDGHTRPHALHFDPPVSNFSMLCFNNFSVLGSWSKATPKFVEMMGARVYIYKSIARR